MPTVTWARVDPARRAAVIEAAEAEFGAHGFSNGSLNVIARRAGVAKGSLFQYFADKRDLYAYIADVGSQRVRAYVEGTDSRARPEPALLRVSHRPARRLGCLLRRASPRTCAACRGDAWKSTPTPASACAVSSTATTWRCCGPWCEARRRGRPAAGLGHRRVVVVAADDLPAPGAGAVHARSRSDPRSRRAHAGAAGARCAQARSGAVRRVLRPAASHQPSPDQRRSHDTHPHSARWLPAASTGTACR